MQKIRLADYIHHIADLSHMDVVQQLEVALLGLPASSLIDILAARLQPSTISTILTMQPPHVYTATQMAPPPTSVPMVGLTCSPSTLTLSIIKAVEPSHKISSHGPYVISTIHEIISTACHSSISWSLVEPFLMVLIAELAIPPEVMLEQINQPDCLKNYQC